MGTTKEQRVAASAIIEKFTANDVTFTADFVLALLSDAEERDRLAERVRELEDTANSWREQSFSETLIAAEQYARAETAESNLAAAVEALEYYVERGDASFDDQDGGAYAAEVLAKIKGAP